MHEENGPSQLDHEDERKQQQTPLNPSQSQPGEAQHVTSAAHLRTTSQADESEATVQPQVDPMSMPGVILKQARERMHYSLESMAQHLKLSVVNVQALEKDEYESMNMAPVFVKGHLRRYAKHVKIDPEYMIRCYAQAGGDVNEHNALQGVTQEDHQRLSRKNQIKKWLLIDALIMVMIVTGIYWYMYDGGRDKHRSAIAPSALHEISPKDSKQQLLTEQFKHISMKPKADNKQVFTLLKEAD